MRATSGIFKWQADAERACQRLHSVVGLPKDRINLLVPGGAGEEAQRVPVSNREPPGMGNAFGAVAGAAIGMAAGFGLGAVVSAAMGRGSPLMGKFFWSETILGVLGAAGGAAPGNALDHASTEGLPADEWFVCKDALERGCCLVLAFSDDHNTTVSLRALLAAEGAESIDEGRKQWWIGLRSAEHEQYSAPVLVDGVRHGNNQVSPLSGQESSDSRAETRSGSRTPRDEKEVEAT
jgi:hypothetical protein